MRCTQVLAMLALFGFAGWSSMVRADDRSDAVPQQQDTATPDPRAREVVCRREQVLGSHMSRKVCRTREEIEAERQAAQAAVRELRGEDARGATD